jgi:hypothetical protein
MVRLRAVREPPHGELPDGVRPGDLGRGPIRGDAPTSRVVPGR